MKKITKDELNGLIGKTLYILNSDHGRIKGNVSEFIAALDEDSLLSFAESIRESVSSKDCHFFVDKLKIYDLSYLNALFRSNYPGFTIIDLDYYVPSDLLFEKRKEVVDKIHNFYSNNGVLYIPLDKDGRFIRPSIGNTMVSAAYFTSVESATALSGGPYCEQRLPMWLSDPTSDLAVLSVDGEVVYGWEMREGSYNAWNEYVHSPEELENVIGDNMLHVLTSQDGSGAVMRVYNVPIFFTDSDSLEAFHEANTDVMTHEFFDALVKIAKAIELLSWNSAYLFIETQEGRYAFKTADVVQYYTDKFGYDL